MNDGANFSLALPVNYEDTDAGGVVYYGNYLGYMERARNACLRRLGLPPTRLQARHSVLFVVTEARLKYLAAARLDDEIEVTLAVARCKRASVVFRQQVLCGGRVLVDGEITVAMVNCETFAPCRMPAELVDALARVRKLDQQRESKT